MIFLLFAMENRNVYLNFERGSGGWNLKVLIGNYNNTIKWIVSERERNGTIIYTLRSFCWIFIPTDFDVHDIIR